MPPPPTPSSKSSPAAAKFEQLLERIQAKVAPSGLFGPVTVRDGVLICPAKAAAAPASYRLEMDERSAIWVSLVMADRWLSQSIEQDLVHTGDKLADLLEEELTDLAPSYPNATHPPPEPPVFEHFRSTDLLFTFRSPIPIESPDAAEAADTAALWLAAYEATFRNLGDMVADEEE